MHTPYPFPLDSPLAISYRNYQKSLECFSHLRSLVLLFFSKSRSQKGGGGHGTMPGAKILRHNIIIMTITKIMTVGSV